MKHSPKQIPALGVKPEPVLTASEQKNLATTLAATAITNDEIARRESKTARLKALRLAKEAEKQTEIAVHPPTPRSKSVRKARTK